MISRNNSNSHLAKINTQDFCSSLQQKDKIIQILEKELHDSRVLREKYDRLKDRKNTLLERCETLSRENVNHYLLQGINKENQWARVDNSQRTVSEIRSLISTLEAQLQAKQYQLKDLKTESQNFMSKTQKAQNDIWEFGDAIDSVKTSLDVLSMETSRTKGQILQTKQQLGKIKEFQNQTNQGIQKVKNQIHNTQSFTRKLKYEEEKRGQELTSFQNQNGSIEEILEDLARLQDMTKNKIKDMKQQKEKAQVQLKSKQFERTKIDNQYSAAIKLFRTEREKQKNLTETATTRKNQIQRLSSMLRETNEENDDLRKNNLDVQQIDSQLQKDLEVCRRHLQNVSKNNSNVKQELESYQKVNLIAIKKLNKPAEQNFVYTYEKTRMEDMETGEGFLERSV